MGTKERSGVHSFTFEVPYKLVETGSAAEKPLIIYLHGYKQNLSYFEKKCEPLLEIEAYHLFLEGPYPIYDEKHSREVERWGRAWYLFDGRQEQFIQSLEKSSNFIENLVDKISPKISSSETIILGYSMGGYLAGYIALSRPEMIDKCVVVGGRIKTEHFQGKSYPHLKVLALHGSKDQSVSAERAKESSEELRRMGADVTYGKLEEGHRLNAAYINEIKQWLQKSS